MNTNPTDVIYYLLDTKYKDIPPHQVDELWSHDFADDMKQLLCDPYVKLFSSADFYFGNEQASEQGSILGKRIPHGWIWVEDKHYDAMTPYGVGGWRQLYCFKDKALGIYNDHLLQAWDSKRKFFDPKGYTALLNGDGIFDMRQEFQLWLRRRSWTYKWRRFFKIKEL